MKPAAFDYHAPHTVAEAVALLGALPEARVLAGGQSLVPMLNLRVATPEHLVDLGNIAALRGIADGAGSLHIGAMTTQREIERSAAVAAACPLLAEAVRHVGHQQTRNRGTLGGSLCHLDPGAELPVVAAALDAELTVQGPDGVRRLQFAELPAGYLTNTLGPGEILTSVAFPETPPDEGHAFAEFNQRPADFAVVSVAATVRLDRGRVGAARIAVGGIGFAPVRLTAAEAALVDGEVDEAWFAAAAAAAAAIPCEGDEVSPPWFRQHLLGVLVRRALATAAVRAGGRHG